MKDSWQANWPALAEHIVRRALRLQSGERVLYLADATIQPACFEAVREAVLAAGGVEQASILALPPSAARLRDAGGRHPDAAARRREDQTRLDLFNTADIFIWLPTDFFRTGSYAVGQSEWILQRWRGRALHFHWFPDYVSDSHSAIHESLYRIYERAILELQQERLRARQERLVAAIRGRELHITSPDGTDVRLRLAAPGWYHLNYGDASREHALRAACPRDREEELPCGAVRTIPDAASVEGIIAYRSGQALASSGIDLTPYTRNLEMVFRTGRLVELRAGERTAELRAAWEQASGDKHWVGELVLGTNPLLPVTLPGARLPPYWGFGAGGFRFHLGDNIESGGTLRSSVSAELFLTDATVRANGETIIRDGRLLIE